ncbi:hypothetical protein E3N88_17383 [Mikania micrantha]|uniref:Uncharacterized protein n=1 Tax=Mikania micrantha TaxID=192012 RepID=A0A5N6NUQ6_9ASTR|nr:hypothetical protein E3N88_17383 [Mikania micrantha]
MVFKSSCSKHGIQIKLFTSWYSNQVVHFMVFKTKDLIRGIKSRLFNSVLGDHNKGKRTHCFLSRMELAFKFVLKANCRDPSRYAKDPGEAHGGTRQVGGDFESRNPSRSLGEPRTSPLSSAWSFRREGRSAEPREKRGGAPVVVAGMMRGGSPVVVEADGGRSRWW